VVTALGLLLAVAALQPVEAARIQKVLACFESCRVCDRLDYISALRAKGDTAALATVAHSGKTLGDFAAGAAVECLPADQVVAFVRQLPAGSAAWQSALHRATTHHPKGVIIGYLKSIPTDATPVTTEEERLPRDTALWYAYRVCEYRSWDELVEWAREHVNDTRHVCVPNSDGESLGDAARRYLKSLQNKSPRP
jgi:hypothetical protein